MATAATAVATEAGEWLTKYDVAKIVGGVSPKTVERWWQDGHFPQPVKFTTKLFRWRRADVLAWLDAKIAASRTTVPAAAVA